jgi:protein SCO1
MRGSAALLILLGIMLSACSHRSANEKRYELKGKVVAVEKDKRLVTIAHEDIKGYMGAMVMPFAVKEDWPLEVLAPGNTVTATLVVDGSSSWLENFIITSEATDSTAPDAGPPEAKAGDELPNFALTNQDDKRIRMNDYRGKVLVLTFIYTRCPLPEYCTLMSANFAAIEKALGQQPALYERTHLLTISFDPDYDTPKVLRSYGAAYTGRYSDETFTHWEFATGSKDEVKGIAQFFGLRYYADSDQIIHGLRTAIIGPDGKVVKNYRGNDWKPEEIIKDLETLPGV